MFTESDNRSLDEIMKSRRICRKFNGQVPSKEDVAAVVEAGRLAPYASISAGDVDVFRHFFVIFKDNPLLEKIDALIRSQSAADVNGLRQEMKADPFLQEYGAGLEKMWSNVAEHGLPAGKYGFHGCIVGYRQAEKLTSKPISAQVHWL